MSPGYLEAIGAHLLTGRTIAERDDDAAPPVAVVNRTLAERYFAGADPVGRELLIDDNNTGPRPVTIVGVVDDLRDVELDGPVRPEVFIAMRPDPSGRRVVRRRDPVLGGSFAERPGRLRADLSRTAARGGSRGGLRRD